MPVVDGSAAIASWAFGRLREERPNMLRIVGVRLDFGLSAGRHGLLSTGAAVLGVPNPLIVGSPALTETDRFRPR
jgi:hypothetical protein